MKIAAAIPCTIDALVNGYSRTFDRSRLKLARRMETGVLGDLAVAEWITQPNAKRLIAALFEIPDHLLHALVSQAEQTRDLYAATHRNEPDPEPSPEHEAVDRKTQESARRRRS